MPAREPEFLDDNEISSLLKLVEAEQSRADLLMNIVIPIGVALVYETEFERLLERILDDAMKLCSADAGALYLRDEGDLLSQTLVRIESMQLVSGGSSGKPIGSPAISVFAGKASIAAQAAFLGEIVNLPHPNEVSGFGVAGYQVESSLALPLRSNSGRVIGVVELANARRADGQISPFEPGMQQVVESLCLIASAALESYIRQQRLKDQVREMSIRIDEAKKVRQVTEIVETDYFKKLRQRAREIRSEAASEL